MTEDSGMEYTALTVQQRIEMLKERMLGYEALHYQQSVECELAFKHNLPDVVLSATAAVEGFEKSIKWCKAEIEKLEASKTE